jgi:Flp pilus assembly protein TadG
MKIPTKNRKQTQRGAAMVEFALAFLLFFTVVYAIMEFGRVVASYNILAGAAREGARYAIVHGSASGSVASASDIQDVVRQWSIGLDRNSVLVTTTWTPGNSPGSQVKVQAQYTVMPFTTLIIGSAGIRMGSSSQMVISQ